MQNHHRNQKSTSGTGAFRLLVNSFLMLALLVSTFGVAMASSSPAATPEEYFAEDPYAAWGEAFLDFIPPNPDVIALDQPDGSSLQALLTPMETGGLLETLDGYTLIQDAQGWWNYAAPAAAAGELSPYRPGSWGRFTRRPGQESRPIRVDLDGCTGH